MGFDWCDEAPTVELAIKWFRDEKEYFIDVIVEENDDKFSEFYKYKHRGKIFKVENSWISNIMKTNKFNDYEVAKSVALSIAIRHYLAFSSIKQE